MQLINFPCFSSLIGSQIARTYCPRILRLKSRLYSFFRGWHFLLKIEYSQVWIKFPGGQNSVTIGCRAFAPDLTPHLWVWPSFKFAQAAKRTRFVYYVHWGHWDQNSFFKNLLVILDTRSILWGGLNVKKSFRRNYVKLSQCESGHKFSKCWEHWDFDIMHAFWNLSAPRKIRKN